MQANCAPIAAHIHSTIETPGRESHPLPREAALAPVVGLLAASVFINYIDRANLGTAAPKLALELSLTPSQIGILLSAFFWTYWGFQIPVGWLVERFNVNWIIAGGFLLWSAATAVTGVVHGFALLLLMRLLLGAGESVAFPSCSKILAKHCPEIYRGRANATISAGLALGPASGIFFGAMLMEKYGWRPFFVSVGLLSMLWLVFWGRWMPKGPGLPIAPGGRSPGMEEILLQRSAWGTFLGLFSYNYLSYFLISWLPTYLVNERGFSMQRMGVIAGSAFLVQAAVAMLGGFVADRWIAGGGTPTVVRKTFTTSGLVVASCSCVAVSGFARNDRMAILFLFLTCVGAGLCTSNLWAITQTIAGPHAAGKWTGLQNFAGNIAGIISPLVPGFVAQRTGHFFWAFAVTSAVLLCGAFSWVFIVGRVEPANWDARAPAVQLE